MPQKDLFGPIRSELKALEEQITALQARRAELIAGAREIVGEPPKVDQPRAPRARAAGAPSLVDLIVGALESAPKEGMTVGEIIESIRTKNPDRVSAPNISAMTSSGILQHLRGKSPRIRVVKAGGKGVPARYGVV